MQSSLIYSTVWFKTRFCHLIKSGEIKQVISLVCSAANWGLACSGSYSNSPLLICKLFEQSGRRNDTFATVPEVSSRRDSKNKQQLTSVCKYGVVMISGAWYVFEQELCSCKRGCEGITYGCFCLRTDPHLSCLCPDLLLLHSGEVSFEEENFKAQPVLVMSEPFLTRTFYSLLMLCILLTRANAVRILDLAFLFFFRIQLESWMQLWCCHKTKFCCGLFPLTCQVLCSLESGRWYQSGVCLQRDKKALLQVRVRVFL